MCRNTDFYKTVWHCDNLAKQQWWLSWGPMVSASCNQGVWYHQQRISWSNSGGLPTRDDKRLCCLVGLQGFSGQQLLWRSLLPSSQRLVELLASYGKCHDQLVVYICAGTRGPSIAFFLNYPALWLISESLCWPWEKAIWGFTIFSACWIWHIYVNSETLWEVRTVIKNGTGTGQWGARSALS